MSTWQLMGDEFLQGMYRYLRTALSGRAVADVIGEQGGTFKSWANGGYDYQKADGARSGFEIYASETRPDLIVIVLGTNPAAGDLATEDLQITVRDTVKFAPTVFVGPFANDPTGKRLKALRRFAPDAIDGQKLAQGLPRDSDGIHLTQAGYEQLAARMVEVVLATVTRRSTPKVPASTPITITPVTEPPTTSSSTFTVGTQPVYRQRSTTTVTRTPSGSGGTTARDLESKTDDGAEDADGSQVPVWVWVALGAVGVGLAVLFVNRSRKASKGLVEEHG